MSRANERPTVSEREANSITNAYLAATAHAESAASVRCPLPTYEYKCPTGHVFEVFKRISDPPPEACPVCGASPVETVLYPVPVHFRGSGFYTTDYGRGKGAKKDAKEAGDSASSDSDKGSQEKPAQEKKAAEA
jgi:putative FmdB family regulatory protein